MLFKPAEVFASGALGCSWDGRYRDIETGSERVVKVLPTNPVNVGMNATGHSHNSHSPLHISFPSSKYGCKESA